jgi:RNA polymerase sigma-54 factor
VAEDKQHPKSDDQLVKDMAADGITVARRTVTKYRKAMNIPSSRQRRDWGAAGPDGPVDGADSLADDDVAEDA